MAEARAAHTATRLSSGQVLLVGGIGLGERGLSSTELFTPSRRVFRAGPATVHERGGGHEAVLLRDGRVLVLGGWSERTVTASAELYEPERRAFRAVAPMRSPRAAFTATRLRDGRVLVAGGLDGSATVASAEVYDPATGVPRRTGSMRTPRAGHTAVLLGDGRVLLVGGSDGERVLASAELFDPATGTFEPAAGMAVARHKHGAVLLRDGRVLVVGGSDLRDWRGRFRSTEVYDPRADAFTRGPRMRLPRFKIAGAVAVARSAVLVAGSERLEAYEPARGRFRVVSGSLGADWQLMTATALRGGRVLVVGGYDPSIRPTARAWLFAPG